MESYSNHVARTIAVLRFLTTWDPTNHSTKCLFASAVAESGRTLCGSARSRLTCHGLRMRLNAAQYCWWLGHREQSIRQQALSIGRADGLAPLQRRFTSAL